VLKEKGVLQKISFFSGVISFLLAFIVGIALYFQVTSADSNGPVSASLIASIFFFVCVGIVLAIMGRADIPSFKFNKPEE